MNENGKYYQNGWNFSNGEIGKIERTKKINGMVKKKIAKINGIKKMKTIVRNLRIVNTISI